MRPLTSQRRIEPHLFKQLGDRVFGRSGFPRVNREPLAQNRVDRKSRVERLIAVLEHGLHTRSQASTARTRHSIERLTLEQQLA